MIKQKHPNLMGEICLQSFIYDDIEYPMDFLGVFFDYRNLSEHLIFLKDWKHLVETHNYVEINTTTNLSYDHKMMANLLNAAFVIHEIRDGSGVGHQPEGDEDIFIAAERLNQFGDVGLIDISTAIDPYLGIEKVFEYFTLKQYHEQLYEWLTVSFSPNVKLEDRDLMETMYRNLQILLTSAWLIYSRDPAQTLVDNLEPERLAHPYSQPQPPPQFPFDHEIPAGVMIEFKKFLDLVPADRLNRGLRKMLMDYLAYNQHGLPNDFEDLLTDLYWLTDLLDEIQGKTLDPKFA